MSKIKSRFITVIACFALLVLSLGIAFLAIQPITEASAATASPSSIFWALAGSNVSAYSENKEDATAENPFGYTAFLFGQDGTRESSVELHRNLALKWYLPVNEKKLAEPEKGEEDEGEKSAQAASVDPESLVRKPELVYFGMSFSFPEVNFDTFTITFQSTEENVTKKGQSVNEIIFKNTTDGLYAFVKDSTLQDDEHKDYFPESDTERVLIADPKAEIKLAISENGCTAGEFALTLNGSPLGEEEHSKLTNVGGYYMEYRTSGTANVPMTFKATLPEGATKTQKVLMKELNLQTLKVTNGTPNKTSGSDEVAVEEDGTVLYAGGSIEDNAAPALVFNQKLYAFTLGQRYPTLDYEEIDVCNNSVSASRYYYMAKKDESGKYVLPNLTEAQNKENGYQTLSTSTYFLPKNEKDDKYDEVEYVSIRFVITDGRDNGSDEYYYLTWYADQDADVVSVLGEGDQAFDYFLVNREKEAPYYTIINAKDKVGDEPAKYNEKTADYDTVVQEYQDELNKAAEKVSAGDGAYFYLPSLRNLITSDCADYRNLRFSIYYYKPGVAEGATASSETGLRYNNLRFEIEEPGVYKFRIMAADAAGNTMQMFLKEGAQEEWKLTALSSSNIWDIEEIPDFTIDVDYTGAVIEEMKEQTPGNRGTSYSISSFDIVAYGSSTREYTLYYFDESKLPEGVVAPTYSELVKNTKHYVETYADCFKEISVFNSDITEDDEDWDRTDNAYHWSPGTTPGSFTPQKSGYYIVKLLLVDNYLHNAETEAYQAIEIGNPVDVTPGQINWFENTNNVLSVVFFALAAAVAVALVVVCFVKPAEKNVEDVDLDKLKGRKKNDKS